MYAIDDKVTGNPETTSPEDLETGRVVEIDGDQVTVAWTSGVRTTQSAELLAPAD